MAGGSRSRSGCWTCRLRRKKCDERRPGCETCEKLGISCHGYANRPDWMDGGEQEKAKSAEVRRDIKSATRRDAGPTASQPSASVHEPSPRVSPTLENATHHEPRHSPQEISTTLPTGTNQSDRQLLNSMLGLNVVLVGASSSGSYRSNGAQGFGRTQTSEGSGDIEQRQMPVIKERDASLLMYYMDCVFPMQFKMYNPAPAEGGRGWLLSLLLRTPPLYYMSLALAAHCMEVLEIPNGSDESKGVTSAQLASALQNLQQYITMFNEQPGPGSLEENIKVLVCIMQMIGFVGFAGGTENWQVHMKGASTIVSRFTDILCSSNSTSHLFESNRSGTVMSVEELITVKFLVSIFSWIEIANSVSSGSSPTLGYIHDRLLGGQDPPIRLDKVMGCDNTVMILIAKIGALDEWKRDAQATGKLSMMELVTRASSIEKELMLALSGIPGGRPPSADFRSLYGLSRATLSVYFDYVTEAYTLSALVYLHVVVSGPHAELQEIRNNVSQSVELFRRLPEPIIARALYWPILVTGSMALPEEENLFKEMLAESGVKPIFVGPGWNIIKILEECWRRRRTNDPLPVKEGYWADIMSSLDTTVLLL
ncbi:uncharacterized protein LY89DRAFT_672750 [Mollisia scopiformis]|uniref:Zn(2)-C6 fungal-type domain-containing protein n=1 Tax=Mollisia scopiformis TaxID=149040 RepID=A0A194X020_MOLSC|nr:uncharacterized protein LY89DRAFT_672750 [Mollisia scopiformis]KUJ13543.1 hypothetical protein LY89DRAFT_672750 [Mollisia scopiformis]